MKNLKLVFLILIGLSTSLLSCNRATDSNERSATEAITDVPIAKTDMHNSMNGLDWSGTYKGTLPCADCEGIETTLTLNTDLSYVLVTNYLGRNDALEEEKKGDFSWDEQGSEITLTNVTSGPNKYKVGENLLWHLDANGDMITGDSADHYILKKK
jgi:uncharacterized lipoprotein NlpE involved in copper resistance